MANKRLFFWLAILLLIPFGQSSCTVETAHAPVDELTETPTAVPTATFAPNTAVVFKRSGGIAGVEEEWTIFTDGRIQTNTTIQPRLSTENVSQLLASLDSTGFFSLSEAYLPEDSCCDRFLYEITAVKETTFYTVTTLEDTPDMPESLQQTLRLIQNTLFADNNQ
ncbi:hypothetical protein [Candidatus Leptofilum sp.]|uniref:hypothetical protein n=1 Tax=Candidatus Leptofilum sp. TaxID=3241576 RepID=UPI003B5C5D9D